MAVLKLAGRHGRFWPWLRVGNPLIPAFFPLLVRRVTVHPRCPFQCFSAPHGHSMSTFLSVALPCPPCSAGVPGALTSESCPRLFSMDESTPSPGSFCCLEAEDFKCAFSARVLFTSFRGWVDIKETVESVLCV